MHTRFGFTVVIVCPGPRNKPRKSPIQWVNFTHLTYSLHPFAIRLFLVLHLPHLESGVKGSPVLRPCVPGVQHYNELLLETFTSTEAQSVSWRSSAIGLRIIPQALLPWAKVVPSIKLQRYCPSHDPMQSCLGFQKTLKTVCSDSSVKDFITNYGPYDSDVQREDGIPQNTSGIP